MQDICGEHNQQIVGFDPIKQKALCLFCIAGQTNIVLNEEATILIKRFKVRFLEEYEQKFQRSIEIVTRYSKIMQNVKIFFSKVINKMVSNLNDWEISMRENKKNNEQEINNIENLNFEAFIKKINKQELNLEKKFKKLIFEQSSQLLSKQKLDDSVSCLKLLLDQSMVIQFDRAKLIEMGQIGKKQTQVQFQQTPKQQLMCNKHNQSIDTLNITLGIEKEKRLLCSMCMINIIRNENKTQNQNKSLQQQLLTLNEAQESLKQREEIIKSFYNDYQEKSIKKAESIIEGFKKLKSEQNQIIDEVIVIVNQQSNSIWSKTNMKFAQLEKDIHQMTENDLIEMAQFLSEPFNERTVTKEISQDLENIEEEIIDQAVLSVIESLPQQQHMSLNGIFPFLKEFTKFKFKMDAQRKQKATNQQNQIKQQQVPLQNPHPQTENFADKFFEIDSGNQQKIEKCYSLCFNKENNVLAVGSFNVILIFSFENNIMTLVQVVDAHQGLIKCLFFGANNTIYSCSNGDKQIKIWTQEQNQWKFAFELLEHEDSLLCIILNRKENMLISGSFDKSIKCWIKNSEQWKCEQTLKVHNDSITFLALNDLETLLLSCGRDKKINIFELDKENKWQIKQLINAQLFVIKVSFIGDNYFVIQFDKNDNKVVVQIYEKQDNNYEMKDQICDSIFQGQQILYPYIGCDQKVILKEENVNLGLEEIKKIVSQKIIFSCDFIYGILIKNGQYLVTWDSGSQQIFIKQKLLD